MATVQYKTPGVYIQEPDSFPPSIVAVETAVPAFIGHTERAADSNGRSLLLAPTRIESMAEYAALFGGMYPERYYLEPWLDDATESPERPVPADPKKPTNDESAAMKAWDDKEAERRRRVGDIRLGGSRYRLMETPGSTYNLYSSLRLFYANGGGPCYIVSCGDYDGDVDAASLLAGVTAVANVTGPTMLVAPDAVLLPLDGYADVANAMLAQCLDKGDRIALLDVHGADDLDPADQVLSGAVKTNVRTFRERVGPVREAWRYGVAYFPFLQTSVVQPTDIGLANFDLTDSGRRQTLLAALADEINLLNPPASGETVPSEPTIPAAPVVSGTPAPPPAPPGGGSPPPAPPATPPAPGNITPTSTKAAQAFTLLSGLDAATGSGALAPLPGATAPPTMRQRSEALAAAVPALGQLFKQMAAAQNLLPPSGAIAGIYAMNDAVRGVWNAPANVGIAGLIAPNVPITDDDQEDLNVPLNGKAVNAIRTFPGRGSLVWGARTLDSNSNDWRYVQVRRTMIFVEQSVKTALNSFVFAPNTAQTWVTVTSMIESFLHGLWSAGGLMGASPTEAYNVQAGLGSTMTPTDVLEGRMIVQITLQMVRPAEFIVLTFRQQMLGAG